MSPRQKSNLLPYIPNCYPIGTKGQSLKPLRGVYFIPSYGGETQKNPFNQVAILLRFTTPIIVAIKIHDS